MAWIKWDKVLSRKKQGGLEIGSLKVSNLSMLTKWWWRFKVEPKSLWCNIIKSIHGVGGFENPHPSSGSWNCISKLKGELLKENVDLSTLFKKKIGNGNNTSFWNDLWVGAPLKVGFDRLFALETHLSPNMLQDLSTLPSPLIHFNGQPLPSRFSPSCGPVLPSQNGPSLVGTWASRRRIRNGPEAEQWAELQELLLPMGLSREEDTWACCFGESRHLIEQNSLISVGEEVRWNKFIPIKVNINSFRIVNERLR